jgi:hypothetical protein
MKLVAGIDIGNATTETAIAVLEDNSLKFLASGITKTTGLKGTEQNINGVFTSSNRLDKCGLPFEKLDLIGLTRRRGHRRRRHGYDYGNHHHRIHDDRTQSHDPRRLGLGCGYTADIRDLKSWEGRPVHAHRPSGGGFFRRGGFDQRSR